MREFCHLPAADDSSDMRSRRAPVPTEVSRPPGEVCDVLLVEDFRPLRTALASCLRQAGYRVQDVANGRGALACLETTTPRLIVTDIVMPEVDGFQLLSRLRQLGVTPPIVAMSGDLSQDFPLFLKVARHLGARHALTKPFGVEELLATVRATIGAPQGERDPAVESPDTPPAKS